MTISQSANCRTTLRPRKQSAMQWFVLAGIVFVVSYGFWRGNATDSEAAILLSATSADANSSSNATNGPRLAHVLRCLHELVGANVSLASGRFFSIAALAACVTLTGAWTRAAIGKSAVVPVCVAMSCSAPVLLLGSSIAADAWVAALFLAAVAGLHLATDCWFALHPGQRRATQVWTSVALIAGATIATLGSFLLINDAVLAQSASPRLDHWLAPLLVIFSTFPWSFAALALFGRHLNVAASGQRRLVATAAGLAIAGIILSFVVPALWLGFALVAMAGFAMLYGVIWDSGGDDSIEPSRHFRCGAAVAIPVLALPIIAVTAATTRIATVYNFMERYQVIVVVGLGALSLTIVVIRHAARELLAFPVLVSAIAVRVVFVHAWIPERDHWWSAKAPANALAARLPEQSVLYTDQPLGPGFRYYLGRPVRCLDELQQDSGKAPRFGLIGASSVDLIRDADMAVTMIRNFHSFRSKELWLVRFDAPTHTSPGTSPLPAAPSQAASRPEPMH